MALREEVGQSKGARGKEEQGERRIVRQRDRENNGRHVLVSSLVELGT